MFGTRAPIAVLREQFVTLSNHLPGVRDGCDQAIHDARVAARRIRETLVLARGSFEEDEFSDLRKKVRRVGRALGDARDADVLHHALTGLEARFPMAIAATSRLRATVAYEQQAARRRMIKKLETLDVPAIPQRVTRIRRRERFTWHRGGVGWRQTLRDLVGAHAEALRASMQHAAGVYFPNRSHAVRVEVKKLRYALEAAAATGVWHAPRAIRRLKRAQESLGAAHDRQMLIDRLGLLSMAEAGADDEQRDAVVQFLRAEVLSLHRAYLDLRPELVSICHACDRFAGRRRLAGALIAAGVALPSALLLRREPNSASRAQSEPAQVQRDDVQVTVRMS